MVEHVPQHPSRRVIHRVLTVVRGRGRHCSMTPPDTGRAPRWEPRETSGTADGLAPEARLRERFSGVRAESLCVSGGMTDAEYLKFLTVLNEAMTRDTAGPG